METLQSLRSLDVTGGSPGTGRSTTSAPSRESFDDELLEARTAQRRSELASQRHARPERESEPRAAASEKAQQSESDAEHEPTHASASDEPDSTSSTGAAAERRADSSAPQARRAPLASAALTAPTEDAEVAPGPTRESAKVAAPSATVASNVANEVLAQNGAVPVAATENASSPAPANELAGPAGSPSKGASESVAAEDQGSEKAAVDTKTAPEIAKPDANASVRGEARPAFEAQLAKASHDQPASVAHEAPRAEAQRAHATEQAANLLRQVRLQLAPELRQATIQLEPAALGRLDIRIEVRRGRVRAELAVERRETLETLERHAPELRAALGSAGFENAELALSLNQQRSPGHERAPTSKSSAAFEPAPGSHSVPAALTARLARAGGVDTYA